jgi:hypothetical protein
MTIDYELILKIIKELIPFLTTLFAAFFGAWFAYLFMTKQKLNEIRSTNIAAANRAIFVLLQQLNCLKLIQKDFLDPVRARPESFLAMLPILPDDHSEIRYDIYSLDFLLSTKYKHLLLDIWIEQQRFREAIRVLNYRSNLHFSEVQPRLTAAGIQESKDYEIAKFEQVLGSQLYKTLKRTTEQVFYNVDRTLDSMDSLRVRLDAGLKDLFPEADFLKFEVKKAAAD